MEDNLTSILQILGLIIQFLNFLALILAAAAAFYYALQAKRQADKTHELVILGERDYEPNAVARITNTRIIIQGSEYLVPFKFENGLLEVRINLQSLSKGISKFRLQLFPWLENSSGDKTDLQEEVMDPLHRGEKPYVLVKDEIIKGRFVLNLREIIPNYLPPPHELTNKGSLVTLLRENKLNVEIRVWYPDYEITEKESFYDYFYLAYYDFKIFGKPEERKEVIFEGDWIFGGRNEKHLHSRRQV